jgi:hypothetical protein
MDNVFGQKDAAGTADAMTARVLTDAKRAFGDEVEAPLLERYARDAVTSLWRDSIRVTTFVPVLALREIREMLDGQGAVGATAEASTR